MPTNEDVLEFRVAIDIRDSLKDMAKFQREMMKVMQEVMKTTDKTSKKQTKQNKQTKKQTEETTESIDGLTDAYKREEKQVSNLARTVAALEKKIKRLTGAEKAAAEVRLAELQKKLAERDKLKEEGENKKKKKKDRRRDEDAPILPKNFKQFRSELLKAGKALKEPLKSFLDRDLKGLVENSVKTAGSTLTRSMSMSRFLASRASGALMKHGERASFRGKSTGSKTAEAGGAGLKAMAGLMGKLGTSLEFIGKLGPMLGMISGALVGVVKLFLEADAMVKDMNNDIMQSASNVEFLEKSGWSAGAAVESMGNALKGVQEAAMDARFNNALGITKDTHVAILNTLNQEGVAFASLNAQAGNTVEGMKKLTQSIVAAGVGYSRSLGVPLQEINTFQAEMMREMGASVEDTNQSFQHMTRSAAGSGIAANKFFATIRAASTDLSLWNLRLEGAVSLLGKMGKILSPKSAQSFFQTVSSGFKHMGRQDLLKQTLLAGPAEVQADIRRELPKSQSELAKNIQSAGGGPQTGNSDRDLALIVKAIQEGYEGADRMIRTVTDTSKIGTLREKAAEIERKSSAAKANVKTQEGTYEVSQASGELEDMGSQLNVLVRSLEKFGGSIMKPNALGLGAAADNLNRSPEEIRQLHGLLLAANAQKKLLLKQGKKTPEQIAKMTWQEILESDDSLKSSADKAAKDQKKGNESVQAAIDAMSTAQGNNTMSFMKKFDNWVTWFMGQFYSLIVDIWDAIAHPFGGGEEKKAIYKTSNKDLIDAFDKSLDKEGKLDSKAFLDRITPLVTGKLSTLDKSADAREKVARSVGDVSANAKDTGAAYDFGHRRARILDMGQASGLDPKKFEKLSDILNSVGKEFTGDIDLMQTMKDADLSVEEQTKLLSKAMEGANRGDVIGLLTALKDTGEASEEGVSGPAGAGQPAPAAEAVQDLQDTTADAAHRQENTLVHEGVKVAPETITAVNKGMEEPMLSALRTALFEFYLYSGTDRSTLLAAMKKGGVTSGAEASARFGGSAVQTGSTLSAVTDLMTAPGNAAGGRVTGVANGVAMVAAHGEGLASVGRGERIVPAGGAGTPGIHVSVNGVGGQDLARLIEGKVVEGIRDYKRRERLY